MDQPSTDFQWKFQKPNAKVLKQVGQAQVLPQQRRSSAPRARWCGPSASSAPGKAPLIADYQSVPADAMPVKTWQVNIAAKPGFTPKTVAAAASDPADSVHVLPGDHDQAQAGRQRRHVEQARLDQAADRVQAGQAGQATCRRLQGRPPRRVTPVLVADGLQRLPGPGLRVLGHRGQGQGSRSTVARQRASRGQADRGQRRRAVRHRHREQHRVHRLPVDREQRRSPTAWSSSRATRRRRRRRPTCPAPPARPCSTSRRWRPVRRQLVLLEQPPGEGGVPGAVYMTVVNVQ